MALWRPDPTFYPSARLAMEAPQERLAYVAVLNPDSGEPDAMTVVDCDPNSPTYSRVVSSVPMPHVDDELHHFGWNACSASLCPSSAHPHLERRYLVVPSLASSRIYIIDTQPDPERPRIVKTIEAEQVQRAGYSRPHTVHCGPDAIYVSALGAADGGRPGGLMLLDHYTFDPIGPWELDRGPQELAYDFWWHIGIDTMMTSEWGTPEMFENGARLEDVVGQNYGHRINFWDMRRRSHQQVVDLGAQHQMALELRPAHNPTRHYGFCGVVVSTDDLSGAIFLWYRDGETVGCDQGHLHTRRTGGCVGAAAGVAAVGRSPAADHRHRPFPGRQVPVRVLLGHGQTPPVRRVRPIPPRCRPARWRWAVSSGKPRIPTGPRSPAVRRWLRSVVTDAGCTSPIPCTPPGTTSSIRKVSTVG